MTGMARALLKEQTVAAAFFRRDLLLEGTKLRVPLLQAGRVVLFLSMFYFLALYLRPGGSAEGSSDYFAYVVIGLGFLGLFTGLIHRLPDVLSRAQWTGTLESILAAPVSPFRVLVYSSLWPLVQNCVDLALFALFAAFAFGADFSKAEPAAFLLILTLSIISFGAAALLVAGLSLRFRGRNPWSAAITAVSGIAGGVFYPVDTLPSPLPLLAKLLPISPALDAARRTLLEGAPLSASIGDVTLLVALSLLCATAGMWLMRNGFRRLRREGALGHY